MNICGYSTDIDRNVIVPVSSSVHDRAGESEAYAVTNEHTEEAEPADGVTESNVQQQTVSVEVHEDISSNTSTSSPQATSTPQIAEESDSKPLRFIYETRNAIYDIA